MQDFCKGDRAHHKVTEALVPVSGVLNSGVCWSSVKLQQPVVLLGVVMQAEGEIE